jgi:hypothetical protein
MLRTLVIVTFQIISKNLNNNKKCDGRGLNTLSMVIWEVPKMERSVIAQFTLYV